jgi:hypothetical protein
VSGDDSVGAAFLRTSQSHLVGEYIPKIRRCLSELEDADVWWRPNLVSNAVGNLVLHLCGNATQWILHGVLGDADVRCRDAEFAATSAIDLDERLTALAETMGRAFDRMLVEDEVRPNFLAERRTIQGMHVSVLEAVYHCVEHFAQHTGQIIYVAKLRTADDLGFWDVQDGVARQNW